MNFTIDAKALQGALKLAGKLANQKSTIPVITGVMLEATEHGTVVITATDLETACRVSVEATVEVVGVVVLNCKALQSALPKKGMVTIDGHTVHNGAFHVTVPSFPVESYPEIPRCDAATLLGVIETGFTGLIDHIEYAISKEVSRFTLNGALFHLVDGKARMVATDGHRLSVAESPASFCSPNMRMIVPAFSLRLMAQFFNAERSVYIAQENERSFFTQGDIQIITRNVAGTFPDYERVMPRSNAHALLVERKPLLEVVKVAEKHADERSRAISMKLNGCCRIEVRQDGREFTADVPAVWDGLEDWKVLVSAKYLREWLESQTSDTVCLKLKQERAINSVTNQPYAVDDDHEKHALALYGDAGVESVLMPMRG